MTEKKDILSDIQQWSEACSKYTARMFDKMERALFHVSIPNVTNTYLASFPEAQRQSSNCRTCCQVLKHVAGLVIITKKGVQRSAVFPSESDPEFKEIPPRYHEINKSFATLAEKHPIQCLARVTRNQKFGIAESRGFFHMYWVVPSNISRRYSDKGHEVAENRKQLQRCLGDYDGKKLNSILEWFAMDDLPEKAKPCIAWLAKVFLEVEKEGANRDNLLWKFAEEVPVGFMHSLCSGIASVLLQTQPGENGVMDDENKKRYRALLDPTVYQRRVALPSEGNVLEAKKLFASLQILDSDLQRQFCQATDIWDEAVVWKGQEWKGKHYVRGVPKNITMRTFVRDILPIARSILYQPSSEPVPFYGFVTGNKGTYPFMQWHQRGDESQKTRENLVSWYTYPDGVNASEISLHKGEWTLVNRIITFPHQWASMVKKEEKKNSHIDEGYLFVLPEAKDENEPGGCLFPDLLSSKFHAIKSTIEEHNRHGKVLGEQEIVGVAIRNESKKINLTFKVRTKAGNCIIYVIDRFE